MPNLVSRLVFAGFSLAATASAAAVPLSLAPDAVEALDLGSLGDGNIIVVDEVDCTLIDALTSAGGAPNPDSECLPTTGNDVLILDSDVTLYEPFGDSSYQFGAQAGLPDITSDITLISRHGQRIYREPFLGCEDGESNAFRLFNVVSGSLTLFDLDLHNGCVAPTSGEAGGGAIFVGPNATLRSERGRF